MSDDRCGNCGHSYNVHLKTSNVHLMRPCLDCACCDYRTHDLTDEPAIKVRSDALDRSKIASLCGLLDFQLDSIGFELDRSGLDGVRLYLKESLATLATIVKTNKGE